MRGDAPVNRDCYLVDSSIYVFRAWFSLPDTMAGADGEPVNAVYGFLRFMTELVEQARPTRIVFAFDESLSSSFRNELYPAYKANREQAPPELKRQFELCKDLVRALGMSCLADDRYEADDLIASAASRMRARGYRNVVVSGDKDLVQVLEGSDLWWDFSRDRRLDVNGAHDHFGVWPHQLRDYLALVGDSVDNIPGVPGVGPKSAVRLLRLYESLEELFSNLEQVPQLALRGAGRIAENLRAHREQAFLARELATVVTQVPLGEGDEAYDVTASDQAELRRLLDRLDRGEGYVQRLRSALTA
jgi:5'-3' exonuclease